MCVQVSGCDHSQAIALLSRSGKEDIWELLGLRCQAMGGFAFRFYLSMDFFLAEVAFEEIGWQLEPLFRPSVKKMVIIRDWDKILVLMKDLNGF